MGVLNRQPLSRQPVSSAWTTGLADSVAYLRPFLGLGGPPPRCPQAEFQLMVRHHWMRPGQPSLFPQGGDQAEQHSQPGAAPPKSDLGTRRFSHTGQIPKDVFGDLDGNQVEISRVRCPQPPARPVLDRIQGVPPASCEGGQSREAGASWGLSPPFSLGVCWRPDHPFGAAGLGLSLQGMRRCNWSITACWRAMTANKASRGAVARSRPVMFQI